MEHNNNNSDDHDVPNPDNGVPSRSISPISTTSNHNYFDEDEFAEDYAPSIVAPSIRHDDDENPFADPSATDSLHHISPDEANSSASAYSIYPTPPSNPASTASSQSTDHLQRPNPRSSIRKSPEGQPQNGLSLPRLDSQPAIHVPHRSGSTSSIAAPQSPVDGDNGPSHPYALYPQGLGVSRTASLATTADIHSPSLRASPRPQRPAFPYSMYPQDTSSDTPDASFTVGFPGHTQPFHRRIGADGEEQDIIGLDGHTEQLPPYTRYPDAAVTKGPNDFGSSLPVIGEASQSRDNLLEARRPTSDSMSTSAASNHAFGPSSSSEPLNASAPSHEHGFCEKSFKKKSWKERRHHKLCGCLPVWGLLLGIGVIVIIVVICGGVIGGYVTKLQDQYTQDIHSAESSSTAPISNTYIDAYPITTPTTVSLPTGTFEISLSAPDTRFPACLDASQAKAWSCDLPLGKNISFKISGSPDKLYLDIVGIQATNVTYGSQPPELRGEKLKLMMDMDDRSLGAAYHFQTFYDKVVIIPDDMLSMPPPSSGLQGNLVAAFSPRSPFSHAMSFPYAPVMPGDYAWFCRWDDTFIEGFIYATEIIPEPQPTITTTLSPTTTPSTTPTTNPRSYQPQQTSMTPPFKEAASIPITTPPPVNPYSSPPYEGESEGSEDADGYDSRLKQRSPPEGFRNSSSSSSSSSISSTTGSVQSYPPIMTNIVKLEERRLEGFHGMPVCTRMTYLDDFQWVPAYESEKLVTIELKEDDGGNWLKKYRYRVGRRAAENADPHRGQYRSRKGYHGDLQDTCYCQWISYVPPPPIPIT